MQPLHVVFGYGQVGSLLGVKLVARDFRVRVVSRHTPATLPAGVEHVSADVYDLAAAKAAAAGAAVVYNCVNAPYDQWPKLLPPLMRNVLAAATAAGARLVVLDNLYMYGASEAPLTEHTPMQPHGTKGRLRAMLAQELFAAHARGEVQVTSGRASDYFGPGAVNSSLIRPRFFERLLAGKRAECFVNADLPHSFSYTPDVAEGLAILGTDDRALGRAWHLPVTSPTQRQLVALFARELGVPGGCATIPSWVVRVGGLFSGVIRELIEMEYEWARPYISDDSEFRRTFGMSATPLETAVRETARWGKATYGVAPNRSRRMATA